MNAPAFPADPYPSRTGGTSGVLPRQDPVIRGDSGPLDPAAAAGYARDGFALIEDLVTGPALAELAARMDALWREAESEDRPEVIREPGTNTVRSVFAVHESEPLVARLIEDPRIQGIARQILGSDAYVHQSRVNFKPGFDGKEFAWHSDFETWHVEDGMPRMRAFSLSLALVDSGPHNGPLMLMPGSHQEFVVCAGHTPERHYEKSLRRQEYGVPDRAILTGFANRNGIAAPFCRAGSGVIFDCNTMHGSNGNITPFPRHNLFIVFNSTENRLVTPFGGQAPRPRHIATR